MRQRFLMVFAAISMFVYGCGTSKSALDNESAGNGQLPSDFNAANGVLLIEHNVVDKSDRAAVAAAMQSENTYVIAYMTKNRKQMIEYADKNYPYKHEFATPSDIYDANSKYSDKTIYRYALVTSMVKPVQHDRFNERTGQLTSTNYQPIFRFYLYDRLNDKTYAALGHGSSLIMWAYKAAIKKLSGSR